MTAQFPGGRLPPVEMLKAWIDESYRAQAPKKLVATLGGGARGGSADPARPDGKGAAAPTPAGAAVAAQAMRLLSAPVPRLHGNRRSERKSAC
ncbi:MAG: hypothetical protein HYZ28_17610 [Myxococcales bacterium]|nr:hypothetical protein [Myxococcales bacterium]